MSTTNDLTNKILAFLFSRGVFAWRSNTAGIYDARTGRRRGAAKVGVADIIAVLPPHGRLLCIEIKTGSDRMRPEQMGFATNINAMGGIYLTAHNFNDFMLDYDKVIG